MASSIKSVHHFDLEVSIVIVIPDRRHTLYFKRTKQHNRVVPDSMTGRKVLEPTYKYRLASWVGDDNRNKKSTSTKNDVSPTPPPPF